MSLTITDHVFCCVPAGSNDSSQYFGSVDSSQTSQKANGQSNDGETRAIEGVQSEHFNKYVPHSLYTHCYNPKPRVSAALIVAGYREKGIPVFI